MVFPIGARAFEKVADQIFFIKGKFDLIRRSIVFTFRILGKKSRSEQQD